jgi:catechol 2,3-dioxygenase-like lactoylglutathione lyase family enzyme
MKLTSLIYTVSGAIEGRIVEVRFLISKIQHITFAVSDIKKAVSFYENVLGLKKTGEWDNYVVFEVGGVELAFGLNETFQMFLRVDDVDEAYQSLKTRGVKFLTEPKNRFWGGRTAEFVDPDRNKFTLESRK